MNENEAQRIEELGYVRIGFTIIEPETHKIPQLISNYVYETAHEAATDGSLDDGWVVVALFARDPMKRQALATKKDGKP